MSTDESGSVLVCDCGVEYDAANAPATCEQCGADLCISGRVVPRREVKGHEKHRT